MDKALKIVFVPLDERPCNYEFPYLLAQGTEHQLVRPPMEMMGFKKLPGHTESLWSWTEEQSADADGAILSIDTLLYGGIIPSRLHALKPEEIAMRIQRLRGLKEHNPKLKVFAFQLIMRCPQYSIADEEPDYYADWGREIFRQGFISHRKELAIATSDELKELEHVESQLPVEIMADYMNRRAVNIEAIRMVLDMISDGIIDFMIIPQDDSAPYGHTAKDQQKVRALISNLNLELKTYMYPGADEVGCTLLARMVNENSGKVPMVYPRLAAVQGGFVIPLFEDRFFYESLKYQIIAAGGLIASSAEEADMILLINTPGETMMEAVSQQHSLYSYDIYRNIIELVEYGNYMLRHYRKPVAIADVGYANGGDLKLVKMLRQKEMLFELAGYAGWNTSSNTLGTVICQSMLYLYYGRTQAHLDFLSLRYAEDVCYCAVVRETLNSGEVASMGLNKFQLDGQRGQVSHLVWRRLEETLDCIINTKQGRVEITDCYMPWNRTFEVGLSTRFLTDKDK
ncbi:DUF4127 family protein [Paenibacillus pini]|uniref:DUF4127 family protein n=1 Tax=Paenibacillus pini JCM 16418 TaxID=1236976 RepID=W7Y744_9BACL|nr:DUF4127 family protein [Paenibacillus pini]GAF06765.1 hypothetical protein JCM16418_746 [Paenibacillus pini JCM 16418]